MQRKNINILKVSGIQIKADYSWFIILGLITWSFVFNVVPAQFPDLHPFVSVSIGIIMTVLFFTSLLIHEMAHAFYAQSKGLEIDSITLFIFGGAAEIHEEPKKPRQEFTMAFLGPLTSIILTGFFTGLLLLGLQINFVPFIAVGSALAIINFFLALFNLLPGLPLDGGRMLRAAAWKFTGDKIKATKIAANGGKVISYLLIALGFLQLINGALLGGVWMIFIALFLNAAAQSSYKQMILQQELEGITVADIMQPAELQEDQPIQLRPDDPIKKALEVMNQNKTSVLFVGKNNHPLGIITADNIKQLLAKRHIKFNR